MNSILWDTSCMYHLSCSNCWMWCVNFQGMKYEQVWISCYNAGPQFSVQFVSDIFSTINRLLLSWKTWNGLGMEVNGAFLSGGRVGVVETEKSKYEPKLYLDDVVFVTRRWKIRPRMPATRMNQPTTYDRWQIANRLISQFNRNT